MSIYNKIRIIFLVAIVFTTAFFGSYFYIQKTEHLLQIQKRYMQTALYVNRHFRQGVKNHKPTNFKDPNLKLFLKESDFAFVKKDKRINHILKQGHIVFRRKVMRSTIKILGIKGNMHLYIENPNFTILLRDKQKILFPWKTLFWYVFALLFLMSLYIWLSQSLKPLKKLQSKIQKVVDGDLSVSVKSSKRDEIADVANAFDDALRKLESLINSRQLFLRSIMHELKTPIAKGKLLNEFLQNDQEKDNYDAIFERLELLLEEFSKIEQMLSSSYSVKIAPYNAVDIIEQALELMIMDEDEIEQKVKLVQEVPCTIHTDFELLSLAIKNLIDNALSYSPDHRVKITIKQNSITFANTGSKFTDSLSSYLKPFHGQNHGLGLGLYIVLNITKMLSHKIEYRYENGINIFEITP